MLEFTCYVALVQQMIRVSHPRFQDGHFVGVVARQLSAYVVPQILDSFAT